MRLNLKIMLLAISIAFLALLSTSAFGYFFGVTETRNHIATYLESEAQGIALDLDSWIGKRVSVVTVLGSVIDEIDKPEQINTKLLQHYRKDNSISDIYIGFEDGRFISGIGWQPPMGYDPRVRPWYIQAKKAGQLNFSTPYLDMTTGKYAVSVGIPLKNSKGGLIGILAEDILLETLTRQVQTIDLGGLGYGFLIDQNGTCLSHPNTLYLNKNLLLNPDTKDIAAIIMKNKNGFLDYTFLDVPKLMAYKTLPSTGWLLGLSVEKNIIYKPLERLRMLYILSGLAIMFLVILASLLFSKQLTRRLRLLTAESRKLANGKPTFDILPEGKDEISELTGAFAFMSERLSQQIFERDEALANLDKTNLYLEKKVDERTQELSMSLQNEKDMQHKLIESEKSALIGTLVAGVAHEINTPLGVAVTATSYLNGLNEKALKFLNSSEMTRTEFINYLNGVSETTEIVERNLHRASELITNFKKISVDSSDNSLLVFDLNDYISRTVMNLKHELKRGNHQINILSKDALVIKSYPGAFAQIITNMVMNSIIHGFEHMKDGIIEIEVCRRDESLVIEYRDNGKGITDEIKSKMFEPFFTTKRDQGGSGLGMYVVKNLVNQKLNGNVICEDNYPAGVKFVIEIPWEEVASENL